MAVTYKKKRFMYQYAKDVLKLPVPAIKDCKYSFCYGHEWLEFRSIDYVCFKLTFAYNGNLVKIKEYYFDDDWQMHVVRTEQLKSIYI